MKKILFISTLLLCFAVSAQEQAPLVDAVRFRAKSEAEMNAFTRMEEGTVCYREDTDSLWRYDGTDWGEISGGSDFDGDFDNLTNVPSGLADGDDDTTDHGAFTGLSDDDHTQYHNDARALTWLQAITSLAGHSWFLDEDNMASNSATKAASQQSIKAYVDAQVAASGDVTKVGTQAANNVGVWQSDGALGGTDGFTYDGEDVNISGANASLSVNGSISGEILLVGATDSPPGTGLLKGNIYTDDSESRPKFWDGTQWLNFLLAGDASGGGISEVSEDTSPVLGGDLYTAGNEIRDNGDVTIRIDADNNGGNVLELLNGAGSQAWRVDESGDMLMQGNISMQTGDTVDGVDISEIPASEEEVQDIIGGMLGGTETLIAVAYDDGSGNIDFVVQDLLSAYTNDIGFIVGDEGTRTNVQPITAIYGQNEADIITDGPPPSGEFVLCMDCKTTGYAQGMLSDMTTDITTGTSKGYWKAPVAGEIVEINIHLLTPGTSTGITVDINKNGSTIASTKITTDATESDSDDATTPYVLTSTTFSKGDIFTWDIDAVPTGGKAVQWTIEYEY